MSNLEFARVTKEELLTRLKEMIERIEEDDSFGGWIEYDAMGDLDDDPPLEEGEFFVRGVYRVGNSSGQGGVRMIHDGFKIERMDGGGSPGDFLEGFMEGRP